MKSCYSAVEGYDWTTGLGEIDDWTKMLDAAVAWAASSTTTSTTTTAVSTSTVAPAPLPSLSTTTTAAAAGGGGSSGTSDDQKKITEIAIAGAGSFVLGILIGAACMYWRWKRSESGEAASYRDELATQVNGADRHIA
jgi:hypothetical protein